MGKDAEQIKCKEQYRKKIVEKVEKVKEYWILDQIYQFIQNITKES